MLGDIEKINLRCTKVIFNDVFSGIALTVGKMSRVKIAKFTQNHCMYILIYDSDWDISTWTLKIVIIIKCLLFLFFAHNFFRENNIPHCEMQTWWLQRRTRKKLFSSRTFRLSSYANTKWKKCLCYKKLSASVFQWKIIPHFYFLQYRKTS